MLVFKILYAFVCLVCVLVPAAQAQAFGSAANYIASLNNASTPRANSFNEWTSERGDLNGDGVADLAMIVSYADDSGGGIRTRLVVLSGVASGGYVVLSESAEYCSAQKFYNLSIQGAVLYVQAVHKADANEIASETIQFRFNYRLGDFEAVGRESAWKSYSSNSWGTLSENLLTGKNIESKKGLGRAVSTKKLTKPAQPLVRLSGFSC